MLKKILLGTVVVFIVWSILDFVIHGIILMPTYTATESLWRPQAEMKTVLMYVVTALSAFFFTAIYGWLVRGKGVATGVKYGLLFGLGWGIAMGYGSYSIMPIPYNLAFTWFVGTTVEVTIGGFLLGLLIKET